MTNKNYDNLSDSQVIALVLEGDDNKYALIVEKYEAKLMRYATYLLKDYDVASDAVQESFIKAYVNLRNFNLKKQFSPWIYRILHNEAMNVIKRSKKTMTIEAINESEDDFFVHFGTDIVMDKKMLNANVRKCLREIDIKYQEVLALTYFDNLKYDEISDILHIPSSTVGVRIKRGKEMMKQICRSKGVGHE